jgi:hypothetical protein
MYVTDHLIAIGMAGALSDFDMLMHYLHHEDFPTVNIKHEVEAIIVGKLFVYKIEESCGYLIRYPRKHKIAVGSGGTLGKSAMELGLDAKKAVKHAIKFNAGCGGKIQSLEFK